MESVAGVPVPPSSMLFMDLNPETMLRNGALLLEPVRKRGHLRRDGLVMDVGCGYGRIAYALIQGGFSGRYLGCDILAKHVVWLQQHVAPELGGRFQFHHLDAKNDRYNPDGRIPATEATLPRPPEPPALVFAFSLFTHMYGEEIAHYVREIASAMTGGSTLWATFFAWNEEAERAAAKGRAAYPMPHRLTPFCRYHDADDPLHAIAFDEDWIRALFAAEGLKIREVIWGSWCGRGAREAYQDTFVVTR